MNKSKGYKRSVLLQTIALAGIILSNAITAAAPALADVSAPVVTVSPTTLYANATYSITFNTTRQLGTGGSISIALPSDTGVQTGNITNNVSVMASISPNSTVNVNGLDASGDSGTHTVIIRLKSVNLLIAEGSQVTVTVGPQIIRNPSYSGIHSLNVSTSNETTPVMSSSYNITLPSLGGPLPNLVTGKNAAGEVIYQQITGDLNKAINTPDVTRIEVGAGTLNTSFYANVSGQSIVGTGAKDSVMIIVDASPAMSITADNVTISGFNFAGDRGGTTDNAIVTGKDDSIQNCTFVKRVSSSGSLVISGCNFINIGSGITITGGSASIWNSNFPGSTGVLSMSSGNVTLTECTISGGGIPNYLPADGGITISGGSLAMASNTFAPPASSNSIFHISGGSVTARYNSFSNATVVRQTAGTADFAHNWWGTNIGPAQSSLNGTVSYLPFLNAPVTQGRVALNASNLTAAASAGVNVDIANAVSGLHQAAGEIGAAKYLTNPLVSLPQVFAYYDVYVSKPISGSTVTIKFYNPPVTINTKIYFAGSDGNWTSASVQGVNVTAGYAYTTISDTSTPAVNDLTGLAFALVNEIYPSAPNVSVPPPTPKLIIPAGGETSVPVGRTGFTWSQIAGAAYDFQLSTDSGFSTLNENAHGLTDSMYSAGGVFLGNMTYFWRVRATIGNLTSEWASANFTTGPLIVPSQIAPPPIYGSGGFVPQPPFVTTSNASPSGMDAIFEGVLMSLGTSSDVTVCFEYGTTTAYGSSTVPQLMTAPGVFNSTVPVLQNTTYHYRAKADGGNAGVNYGLDRTYTFIVNSTGITVPPPVSNNATAPNAQPTLQPPWYTWLLVAISAVVILIAVIFIIRSLRH